MYDPNSKEVFTQETCCCSDFYIPLEVSPELKPRFDMLKILYSTLKSNESFHHFQNNAPYKGCSYRELEDPSPPPCSGSCCIWQPGRTHTTSSYRKRLAENGLTQGTLLHHLSPCWSVFKQWCTPSVMATETIRLTVNTAQDSAEWPPPWSSSSTGPLEPLQ